MTDALRPLLPGHDIDPGEVARRYIEIEAEIESGAYVRYREVLDRAGRALLREHGVEGPSPLPGSLASWPPFPEVPAALRALRARGYALAILSNVDRDLIARSIELLGVTPDLVVTAEDCGSYKPADGHWLRFQRDSGTGPERTVHVGASQYHDMRPAAELGYRTVFIDRHAEPLVTAPTRVLRDLSALPDTIDSLA